MRILFIGVAAAYTDKMTYQDQQLSEQCIKDGHEVYYISDAHEYINGVYSTVAPRKRKLSNGVNLIQLKYRKIINNFISNKLRICKGLKNEIQRIKPDLIYIHGAVSLSVFEICKYISKNSSVKLLVDSHADYYTSGTNTISKYILHGLLYKKCVHSVMKYSPTLLCVSVNCMRFAEEVYKIPKSKLELFPLGGNIVDDYEVRRIKLRNDLSLGDEVRVFIQSGKMDENKKLIESLTEFKKNKDQRLRYFIVGTISETIKSDFENIIIDDPRIVYWGWKKSDELIDLLIASDVYVQPGKVSAIAQNAICAGLIVVLNNLEDYIPFVSGNGFLVNNMNDLHSVFRILCEATDEEIKMMKRNSIEIATSKLDYRKLATKLYQ